MISWIRWPPFVHHPALEGGGKSESVRGRGERGRGQGRRGEERDEGKGLMGAKDVESGEREGVIDNHQGVEWKKV